MGGGGAMQVIRRTQISVGGMLERSTLHGALSQSPRLSRVGLIITIGISLGVKCDE